MTRYRLYRIIGCVEHLFIGLQILQGPGLCFKTPDVDLEGEPLWQFPRCVEHLALKVISWIALPQ